jgi:alpha/beta superfamily hydrolase
MRLLLILFLSLFFTVSFAQNITGMWHGVININGLTLRISMEVTESDNGYDVMLYSWDQTKEGIPGGEFRLQGDTVMLTHEKLQMAFVGVYNKEGQKIDGTFRQGGSTVPLLMGREKIEKTETKRPQTPKPPFAYSSEEIKINNKETGFEIGATVCLPKDMKSNSIVVFSSGSGPQDRDETMMKHKPFAVIADHLATNGIGSIRFDDRGVMQSEGDYSASGVPDFASDVKAVFSYARKKYTTSKIGMLGHSEGGMHIMMANKSLKDADFMVFLACVGVSGEKLYLTQQRGFSLLTGGTEKVANETVEFWADIIKIGKEEKQPSDALQKFLENYYNGLSEEDQIAIGGTLEQFTASMMGSCNNEWFRSFMEFEPTSYWKSMKKVPCLILNGTKDVQVEAEMNLKGFEDGLKSVNNSLYKIHKVEGVNHLFQKCETGMMAEYGVIETTIEPEVLELISTWLKTQ